MTHQLTCAGTYGCHGGTTPEYDRDGDGIVTDLEAIGSAHHTDDACLKAGTLNLDEQGTSTGKSYRFLNGIKGIEDEDWEQDHVNTSHNEYFGSSDYLSTSETISALCTRCHPSYHDTGSLPGGDGLGIGTGLSSWLRHPTDLLSSISNPSSVEPGKDAVMCLSCHRAHASPYDKLLRWDYKSFMPGEGCSTCHTSKSLAYGRSAHGQPDYGVLRTGLPGYERGGCAHCHEQHASINGTEP
jgi:predicted CXXCH cytochrome family protein